MSRTRWTVAVVCLALTGVIVVGDPNIGPPANAVGSAPPDGSAAVVPRAPAPADLVQDAVDPAPALRTGLADSVVSAAEAAAGGSVELGVAVLDRGTGETALGGRGAESFYAASVSKLVVAVDVLDRRRLDGLAVTAADTDLLRRALGPSDDSAMNALWSRFDGAGAAGRVSSRLGLDATTNPDDLSQWGEMDVSAADTVRLWQYILDEMPAADRDLLVTDMQAAPPVADDGFDQAFGLLSPDVDGPDGPGAVAKQGWMCCFSGTYYLHSVGAVGDEQRFLVALLTRQATRGPGWEPARQQLDDIASAAVAPLQ